MPIFRKSHLLIVTAFAVFTLSVLYFPRAVGNDNTEKTQLMALQSKVQRLERELQEIRASLDQNARTDGNSGHEGNKVIISAQDRLTLKAGRSTLQLAKDGTITLSGTRFDVNTTQDTELRGNRINDN